MHKTRPIKSAHSLLGFEKHVFEIAYHSCPGKLRQPAESLIIAVLDMSQSDCMDQGVGLILAALQKHKLADDTLALFLSDNVPPFVNSKTIMYEAGVRLPFTLRVPGKGKGILNTNLVLYVDIVPTLLDRAGRPNARKHDPKMAQWHGRSIIPVMEQATEVPGWDHVFGSHTFHEITTYWPTRYMRNRRFKYHRNICWKLDFPLPWFSMRPSHSKGCEILRKSRSQP